MSMNDQFAQLQVFARHLNRFNEQLGGSARELARLHGEVDPLWRDDMRQHYDAIWNPFQQSLQNYIQREAPAYEQFLESKLRSVEAYLHGN